MANFVSSAYLQEAVYHLTAHILFVRGEEVTLNQTIGAFSNAVVRLKVLGYRRSTMSDSESGKAEAHL